MLVAGPLPGFLAFLVSYVTQRKQFRVYLVKLPQTATQNTVVVICFDFDFQALILEA